MGECLSKSNANSPASSQGNITSDTKEILLLHMSDTKEKERVVGYFRDALTVKASGNVEVETEVNIANASVSDLKDSSWLEGGNNVVLISLTPEAIPKLEQIIKEKGYVKDGLLSAKLFTVSFGAGLGAQWPPNGVQNANEHPRDFAFNFEDVENPKVRHFRNSPQMTSLVAAIKGEIN